MKNKGIVLFLIVLAAIIVVMIVTDYRSERPGRSEANPYALNIDEYKSVDPSLINYKEVRNLKIGFESPSAIDVYNENIYVAGDNRLGIISLSGSLLAELSFPFQPLVLKVHGNRIFLAVKNQVFVSDEKGNILAEWQPLEEDSHITAIAATEEYVFVADAGKRKIYRYTTDGELINEFDGKAEAGALHGFIIPSPCFDIQINAYNELWVTNPGLHSLENYSFDGKLRRHWKRSGINNEGFSGCCNPAHFTFLSDGRFATSEKGLVRIKTYRESGEFEGVVAAPVKFADEGQAPDVAADKENNIYALDFDKKMIRVFSPVVMTGSGIN
ncbi:MAG: hypothetical protein ACOC0R_02460 [Mariniphaga sp.]